MKLHPVAVIVPASRDAVFNFLADIENLPKWAGAWCERIEIQRGRWWALTSEGDQAVDLETNAAAGVIDLRAGPSPDRMNLTPIRVVALSPRRALVSLVLIESPHHVPADWERRRRILADAVTGLLRHFDGEWHAASRELQLAEPGLN